MKILIIEDEQRAALDLQATIKEVMPEAVMLGILDSVESAITWFNTNPTPDLAFFDIQLADGLSFDIFEEVKVECPVVFCTAFDEYALQAFQVNGVDYILKPFDKEAVRRALDKVKALDNFFQKRDGSLEKKLANLLESVRPAAAKTTFLVSLRDKLLPISISDIAYFYIENELTFIHTFDNRRFMLNQTLDELEKILDPQRFFRANRQFLVNAKAVEEVSPYFARKLLLKLKTQTKEPIIVSKAKASEFLQWLEAR
jgi:two-component system, LytTR family, response regulator LytT